ncbi:hypothetical protein DM01DRAFT_1334116 [Hesseltinella vesiculosa]|uniref:DASH complex subunit DAM1 n=1 Tax=Hesseltinella vesiculosa TaxID=101127 RepID=A0A1X2GMW1_9FUNG|nr:hypothetical protein DM01DRAFT_1334116 [Hesseltinella vesiculosa]
MSSNDRKRILLDSITSSSKRFALDFEKVGSTSFTSNTSSSHALTPSTERLTRSLTHLNTAFQTMNEQFRSMRKVDNSLSHFNNAFGAFLFGLAANASVVQFPSGPNEEILAKYKERLRRDGYPPKPIDNELTDTDQPQPSQPPSRKSAGTKRKDKSTSTPTNQRFAGKIDINKIMKGLPIRYREEVEPGKQMRKVLHALRGKPDGLSKLDMIKEVKLPGWQVTECLNVLVRSKDVSKYSPQGQMARFKLEPTRYPTKK